MKTANTCPRLKRAYLRAAFFVAALLVVPFFLRRKSRVLRRVIIHAPPSTIFPLLNELRNWPRWTDWSRRQTIHFSYGGPPGGPGASQSWSSRRMDGRMLLTGSVPDEQVIYHTDLGKGGNYKYNVDGILTLEPVGAATRVTWLCRWESGPNPYARYRDLFMKWFIARDFAAGLSNLKGLVEGRLLAS